MDIASGASIVVISIVLPFVVALCQSESWSAHTKEWIAVVISWVVGIAYVVQSGTPVDDIPAVATALVGGTQTAYLCFSAIGVKSKVLDALTKVKVVVEGSSKEA